MKLDITEDEFRKLYFEKTYNEVAKQLSISRNKVAELAKKLGLSKPAGRKKEPVIFKENTMKSDKKLGQELPEDLLNIQLDEMSNLRKNRTGLPMNVSIQVETDEQKRYKHHLPRLKFQNNTSDRITSTSDLILFLLKTILEF